MHSFACFQIKGEISIRILLYFPDIPNPFPKYFSITFSPILSFAHVFLVLAFSTHGKQHSPLHICRKNVQAKGCRTAVMVYFSGLHKVTPLSQVFIENLGEFCAGLEILKSSKCVILLYGK